MSTATPGAALPLALTFRDDNGRPLTLGGRLRQRPAVLVFADYTCRTLCGPILDFTTPALQKSGLRPGVDYRLIVIGLDPKDGLDQARERCAATHIDADGPLGRAAVFLSGTTPSIRAAASRCRLHYAYDAEHDQFAHPAAASSSMRAGRVRAGAVAARA